MLWSLVPAITRLLAFELALRLPVSNERLKPIRKCELNESKK